MDTSSREPVGTFFQTGRNSGYIDLHLETPLCLHLASRVGPVRSGKSNHLRLFATTLYTYIYIYIPSWVLTYPL